MKVGVLFSGGKDSVLALHKAMQKEEVVCLISVYPDNDESYMFHTPNVGITEMQANAIGLPIIIQKSKGEKEKELSDLEKAMKRAKDEFSIEGIFTGAIESVYQTSRVQKICDKLGLQCFNPLWKTDQLSLLKTVLKEGFHVIISGVFAYPLGGEWLGRAIDGKVIDELAELQKRYSISPSGEGGEIETTVLDAPFFKKRIEVAGYEKSYRNWSGTFTIKESRLVEK